MHTNVKEYISEKAEKIKNLKVHGTRYSVSLALFFVFFSLVFHAIDVYDIAVEMKEGRKFLESFFGNIYFSLLQFFFISTLTIISSLAVSIQNNYGNKITLVENNKKKSLYIRPHIFLPSRPVSQYIIGLCLFFAFAIYPFLETYLPSGKSENYQTLISFGYSPFIIYLINLLDSGYLVFLIFALFIFFLYLLNDPQDLTEPLKPFKDKYYEYYRMKVRRGDYDFRSTFKGKIFDNDRWR